MSQENQTKHLEPGKVWCDTDGVPIQAHGGGMLYIDGTYYWYGENKDVETQVIPFIPTWRNKVQKAYRYRTDLIGVSCYSSKDLMNWKNEGIVLPAVRGDVTHDLYYKNVLERPKVIYNEASKQYVMWMHVDTQDYQYARAGVAVSESPTGPFRYIQSFRPNGNMSRDMTLFKDDDGKAYLFFSSESNKTLHICLLTEDYLQPSEVYVRSFIDKSREAPAVFKYNERYYIITSGCSGWDANMAQYASAASPLGEWEEVGNPCVGDGAEKTFYSQSTYILPVAGQKDAFIFMADRWKKEELGDSRYVWLPLFIRDGKITIEWMDRWDLSIFTIR